MDIYLTPSGGSRIQFPMLPETITMGADAKFMTYSIISLGDVKLPRGQGTKEISWSGMFPGAVRKKNRLVRKYTKPDTLNQEPGKVPGQRYKVHAFVHWYLHKLQRLCFQL